MAKKKDIENQEMDNNEINNVSYALDEVITQSKQDKSTSKLFDTFEVPVSYRLGFPILDQHLGQKYKFKLPNGEIKTQTLVGVPAGTVTMIIGPSQSGKTVMAIQGAWSIIQQFGADSYIIHVDAEKATDMFRVRDILNAVDENELIHKYRIQKDSDTWTDVMGFIKQREKQILSDPDRYLYNTGNYDIYGNEVWYYKPIVIIIDSLQKMFNDNDDIGEQENLTMNMRAAIEKGAFLKHALEYTKKYNINIIIVNHFANKIEISRFGGGTKQATFIPTGKNVPGGDKVVNYTSSIIYVQSDNKEDHKAKIETHGYSGFPVNAFICKSRTNAGGLVATLQFSQVSGFDPRFTLLNFANEKELIVGRNPAMHFVDSDVKFDSRIFIKEIQDKPELLPELFKRIKPYLDELIPVSDPYNDNDLLRGAKAKNQIRELMNDLYTY